MIRLTMERLRPLVEPAATLVVTTADQVDAIRAELPDVPADNVLVEPAGRNTAPCIGLAAAVLQARGAGEETMLVLPADHVIRHEEGFRSALTASDALLHGRDVLLTLGVRPHRPETGYGYIEVHTDSVEVGGQRFHRVARFIEKPQLEVAGQLVADGQHLWNSGMFAWRVDRIRSELERCLPELAAGLSALEAAHGTREWDARLNEAYAGFPNISIDYGVLEKAADVWVAPVDIGWSDVGSWASLAELRDADADGNVIPEGCVALDAQRNIIEAGDRAVVLLGVTDLIVVDAGDAVLVCHRDRAQQVGTIPLELRQRGLENLT
jgi:mannose-1-phosphate guanylyltransferase